MQRQIVFDLSLEQGLSGPVNALIQAPNRPCSDWPPPPFFVWLFRAPVRRTVTSRWADRVRFWIAMRFLVVHFAVTGARPPLILGFLSVFVERKLARRRFTAGSLCHVETQSRSLSQRAAASIRISFPLNRRAFVTAFALARARWSRLQNVPCR
jgi:hypothetical protein